MSATEPSSPAEPPHGNTPEPPAENLDAPPAPEPAAAPAPQPARAPRRTLREWFWRGRAVAEARAQIAAVPASQRERLRRAQIACELADRALDPVDPLRAGSSLPLALSLYREAAYWALTAEAADPPGDLRAAFEWAPPNVLNYAAGDRAEELAAVRRALVEKDFVATAADAEDVQQSDAKLASAFVHALIRRLAHDPTRRPLAQRWIRTGVLFVFCAALFVAAVLVIQAATLRPDIAFGKPWRASSTYAGCSIPKRTCGDTKIFFHTEEDDNPWVEIDLKKSQRFARIDVVNRTDYRPELALPLVLEVSDDQKNWKQVARRDDLFIEWTAKFKPVKARYVRARVLNKTYFHLERISVRER